MLSVAPDGVGGRDHHRVLVVSFVVQLRRRRDLTGHPVDLEHGRVIAAQRVQQQVRVSVSGRYRLSNRLAVVVLSNRAHRHVRLVTRRNVILVGELRGGVRGIADLHARYRRTGGVLRGISKTVRVGRHRVNKQTHVGSSAAASGVSSNRRVDGARAAIDDTRLRVRRCVSVVAEVCLPSRGIRHQSGEHSGVSVLGTAPEPLPDHSGYVLVLLLEGGNHRTADLRLQSGDFHRAIVLLVHNHDGHTQPGKHLTIVSLSPAPGDDDQRVRRRTLEIGHKARIGGKHAAVGKFESVIRLTLKFEGDCYCVRRIFVVGPFPIALHGVSVITRILVYGGVSGTLDNVQGRLVLGVVTECRRFINVADVHRARCPCRALRTGL